MDRKNLRQPLIHLSILAAFLFAPIFVGSPNLWALSASDNIANLIEGAKKEGKLEFSGNMSLTEMAKLKSEFNAIYPFINIDYTRTNSVQLMNRLLMEARKGIYKTDLILLSGLDIHMAKKQGLLKKYIPPGYEYFSKDYLDSDAQWIPIVQNVRILAYNPKYLSLKEAPKSYKEMLDPKWKGRIGLDSTEFEMFAAMRHMWGKEQAANYLRQLVKNDLNLRRGRTLILQLLLAGEFPLCVGANLHRVLEFKSRSADVPVEWLPLEFAASDLQVISLSSRSAHPHSAKLFINFVASKRGQELLRDISRIPARADIAKTIPGFDKLKIVTVKPEWAEDYENIIRDFNAITRQK